MPMITIECSDGKLISVDKDMSLTMSKTLSRQLAENRGLGEENNPIVLENINSGTLVKVLEFCSVHTAPHTVPNVNVWNEKFVRLEPAELCELASAAYHLDIKPLVDLTCKAIAKLLKGKSPPEIRRTFNILYDFSPGDDVPPPTVRDKLRTKLHQHKGKEKNVDSREVEDTRSVEDLLSFITAPAKAGSKSSKKNKKKSKKKKGSTEEDKDTNAAQEHDNAPSLTSSSETLDVTQHADDTELDTSNPPHTAEDSNLNGAVHAAESTRTSRDASLDEAESQLPEEEANDDELDPELDREIEEFRMRLESIPRSAVRPKITIAQLNLNGQAQHK
eukprot:CAMPEP_0168558802 /NCGR_PEP_ID=MMETSP0413-20121227/10173_1 /TAXON_ID=136452 /ORGANISM="Filamoeba nolandi, Strain NC-AS-23-1" /LENGTH=332 /DNA_ID=CAMNT_0008589965 /DNA_START=209 /DNA_END=1207 /DNA_ORIENTATION=+